MFREKGAIKHAHSKDMWNCVVCFLKKNVLIVCLLENCILLKISLNPEFAASCPNEGEDLNGSSSHLYR